MLHSRGFATNENQAFAGQTRTPAASSRSAQSPHRRNMTAGRRPASHLLGQEGGTVGPKQLFGESMSSKTPARPLGEKNTNKTPGPSGFGNNDGSPSKGATSSPFKVHGSSTSPLKKGVEQSTRKASSSSNVLKSTNGRQRQQTSETPFGKSAMTPAPSELGKRAKTMSRQSSFVTPAANVGRAGQIKARMGEMMDAELGLSLPKANVGSEQATAQPTVELTEEEMYPEIEYMPSSHFAQNPVFEFPDELDKLPRAKEVGQQLAGFSPFGVQRACSKNSLGIDHPAIDIDQNNLELHQPVSQDDSDEDPWPDVPIPNAQATQRPAHSLAVASTSRQTGRPAQSGLRPTQAIVTQRTALGSVARSKTAATPQVSQKPSAATLSRTNGLQRSIASTTASSRPRTAMRPAPSRDTQSMIAGKTTHTTAKVVSKPGRNMNATQPKTMLNPALTDFVNDDFGKKADAKIKSLTLDAEQDLFLDLGPVPVDEATAL